MKINTKEQSAHRQSSFSASLSLRRVINLAILTVLYPALSYANPDGAQIVSGQVSIDTATPGVTTVTNSPNAIINWQNFSIAQNELTQFIQQNSQSAVLNRIIGQNPSDILGQLTSNGKVFLINPNGIVFGAGSMVDTQGLIASSLNLSDQDFLNGNYHFIAGSSAGNIVNEGIIRAGKDGSIILIAPQIENNGIIQSDGGSITLAAGQELTITNLDNPDIRFQIQAPADSVLNLGKLLTEGGAINVFAGTITHSGEINADSVQIDKQGHIQLVAQQDITLATGSKISANNSQGDAGTIHIDSKTGTTLAQGTIEAQASQIGKGGTIELLGERVGVLDQARIDASGENGGGQVLIGGDYQGKNPDVHNAKATYVGMDTTIKADAKTNGDGGKVIVWSDETTRVYGDISAIGGSLSGNGGFIETSGHWLDMTGIRINASSPNGQGGEWLLDPYNLTVNGCTGGCVVNTGGMFESTNTTTDVTAATIVGLLDAGTSVTLQTGAGGAGLGDITVNASIVKTNLTNTASLTLTAHNNITIAAAITLNLNSGNLTLSATNTIKNSAALIAANVFFKAGKMELTNGTINGTSSVSLLSSNAINLGSTNDAVANTLELSNAELNTITTPILRIGDSTSGAIDITSALTLVNISKALNLTSGGAITQTAGSTIAALPGLSLSGTSVKLTEANPAGVIAGQATNGDFLYYSSNLLTVGTVDGKSGITVPSANTIGLRSNVGINQLTGANLNGGGLALKTSGSVKLLNSGNNISTVAADLSLGTGSFDFFTGSSLAVGALKPADNTFALNGIATNGNVNLTTNGSLTIGAGGITAGGDMTLLASGNIIQNQALSAGLNRNLILAATGGNYINNVGAGALNVSGTGRWLVYSTNPLGNFLNGLTSSFELYGCLFATGCTGISIPSTGNGLLYSNTSNITLTNLINITTAGVLGTTPQSWWSPFADKIVDGYTDDTTLKQCTQ